MSTVKIVSDHQTQLPDTAHILSCLPSITHNGNWATVMANVTKTIKSLFTYDRWSISVECRQNPVLSRTAITFNMRWWYTNGHTGTLELHSEDQFSIDTGDAVYLNADELEVTVVRGQPMMELVTGYSVESIDAIAHDIHAWANRTFPNRTSASALLKMYGEIGELVDCPSDGEEYADILILLLDLAKMNGVDNIEEAVNAKMVKNMGREWKQDQLGVFSHIKE